MRDGISTFHQSLDILQQTKNDLQTKATQIQVGLLNGQLLIRQTNIAQWSHLTVAYICFQNQAQYSVDQIIQEYEKLHHFLRKEEEAKLLALREEKERAFKELGSRTEKVYGEIATLLETIDTMNRDKESNNILFLQV